MRRIMLMMMLAALLVLMVAPAASAHVHGITPLNNLTCTGVGDADTGAVRTNTTPAGDGGPISGLIPNGTGNAPLVGGDGGKTAPVPVCL